MKITRNFSDARKSRHRLKVKNSYRASPFDISGIASKLRVTVVRLAKLLDLSRGTVGALEVSATDVQDVMEQWLPFAKSADLLWNFSTNKRFYFSFKFSKLRKFIGKPRDSSTQISHTVEECNVCLSASLRLFMEEFLRHWCKASFCQPNLSYNSSQRRPKLCNINGVKAGKVIYSRIGCWWMLSYRNLHARYAKKATGCFKTSRLLSFIRPMTLPINFWEIVTTFHEAQASDVDKF